MFHCSIASALLGNTDFSKYDILYTMVLFFFLILTQWFFNVITDCVVKEMCCVLNKEIQTKINTDITNKLYNPHSSVLWLTRV